MMRKIRMQTGEMNMLEGPLLGKIFAFALPLMLTNLLQTCYSAADMIIVGLSGVDGAIGAIGTTNAMINLVLNVFSGFAVGTSVVVARNIGRGDRTATSHAVHASLIVALVSGLVCAAIGLFISRPVLEAMGDEGHILDLASLYTTIYFIGTPFLALANFMISILRAQGDTRTPLFILTCTGLLNVVLNLLFVLCFGMSVDGVAIATVISNAVSVVLLTIRLRNDTGWCHLSLRRLHVDKSALGEIIHDGLPAGVQGALFSLSNMLIQSTIIGINNSTCPGGSEIIDGHAAGSSIEGFLYTATNSVSQAAVTFTSQHYGARKYKRIGSVMRNCYFVTATIAVFGAALILLLRRQIIGLYITSELAVETAMIRCFIMLSCYFLLAFMETGSGFLRGLGRSITSTVVSLIGSCLLRVIWIWLIFPLDPVIETVYLSYPVSWGLTALVHFVLTLIVRRRLMRQQAAELGIPVEELAD